MSVIGEIRSGKEIGKRADVLFAWHACIDCRKERWVQVSKGQPMRLRCRSCAHKGITAMAEHPKWRGGKSKRIDGYISIRVAPNSPFSSMAYKGGSILEHRLIMAQFLGRCLSRQETVHHRNGVKSDNRRENLELISPVNHILYKQMCSHCELRREIRLLKWQMKQANEQIQELSHHLLIGDKSR